jgi:hypothetical protein
MIGLLSLFLASSDPIFFLVPDLCILMLCVWSLSTRTLVVSLFFASYFFRFLQHRPQLNISSSTHQLDGFDEARRTLVKFQADIPRTVTTVRSYSRLNGLAHVVQLCSFGT